MLKTGNADERNQGRTNKVDWQGQHSTFVNSPRIDP